MTRDEHLMVRAMEECAEVAQRISKALIFGLEQIQQDAGDKPEENPERLTNAERLRREFTDLVAVIDMVDPTLTAFSGLELEIKQANVERYIELSRRLGKVLR